jgi:hypothetical protein
MKNRFYGDVNDYIKYGILDIFSKCYRIGINWYLTDDKHGNQTHGNILRHIAKEKEWRIYNPKIFDALKKRRDAHDLNVKYCREDDLFNFQYEFLELLPDNAARNEYDRLRSKWHAKAIEELRDCDLVFFDPDNGVIKQLSKGVIKDSEYCLVTEIGDYDWCDWLIVIFPGHAKRYHALRTNPITEIAMQRNRKAMAFMYGAMTLLYISNSIQSEILRRIFEVWDTRIDTRILVS